MSECLLRHSFQIEKGGMWCPTPVILALGWMLQQVNQRLEDSLAYMGRPDIDG